MSVRFVSTMPCSIQIRKSSSPNLRGAGQDSRSADSRDVRIGDGAESPALVCEDTEILIERIALLSNQALSCDLRYDGILRGSFLARIRLLQSRFCISPQRLGRRILDLHALHVRIDAEGKIGRQRQRHCRPGQHRRLGPGRPSALFSDSSDALISAQRLRMRFPSAAKDTVSDTSPDPMLFLGPRKMDKNLTCQT